MGDAKGDFLGDDSRAALERDALPRFVARQRWFGGKARAIASVRFHDWARIDTGAHPLFLTVVRIAYADGSTEQCHVPLTVLTSAEAEGAASSPEAVLAPVPGAPSDLIGDAVWSTDAMRALMNAVWSGAAFPSQLGRIVAIAGRAAHHEHLETAADVVPLPAVHSNSALTVGGRYLLKLFRRIEPGINPDVEIGRFLERTRASVNTPALVGSIEYRTQDGALATLALVQKLVPSRANAWDDALEHLESFFGRARQQRAEPTPALVHELVGGYAKAMALLGTRTAELHLALSAVTDEPDFAPEQTTEAELAAAARREREQAVAFLDLLEGRDETLDTDARFLANQVLARRAVLLTRIDSLWAGLCPYTKIRIHGDYHLGQVLCVGDDFVIIDFEGEPARPLVERRAKQSPLRDVAGMLRSLSYAAETGLRAAAGADASRARLAAWARGWESCTSTSFVEGYLHAAGAAVFVPSDSNQFRRALDLFMLHKALYELHYEMNNRPSWVTLPLRGILEMLESGAR
ncbi:MAG: hypothetical protein EHM55_03285 [Acidobacteria bacterium]|nr:MAG: hypothetical protein EHM55_03285 [Acidobacteriota bacterium]